MSKTFRYYKTCGSHYDGRRDKTEDYGYEFEYEVSSNDLLDAVIELIIDDYFEGKKNEKLATGLKYLIKDFGLLDEFVDSWEDALKEMFEEEAMDSEGGY